VLADLLPVFLDAGVGAPSALPFPPFLPLFLSGCLGGDMVFFWVVGP